MASLSRQFSFTYFLYHRAAPADYYALVAGLFAVYRNVEVDYLRIYTLGKPCYLNRSAVRHLMVKAVKQLFPHDLGADLAVRLIRYHVLREERRPGHGKAAQQLHKLVHALAGFG